MQEWIPIIMALIAVGSFAATLYFGREQLKNTKRVLSVQLAMEFDKQFNSDQMRASRKKLAMAIMNGEEPSSEDVFGFFETIGYYSKMGAIDMETVWNDFSDTILHYWPASREFVKKVREKDNDLYWYVNFEWLYNRVLQITAKRLRRNVAEVEPSNDKIMIFLKNEVGIDLN